jgi:hypothetical protein
MAKRNAFTERRFMLAEGTEDAAFVRNLLQTRGLLRFEISPNEDVGSVRGNSGFERALIGCEPLTGFDKVSEVVLLADNDGVPAVSFQTVLGQLTSAKNQGNLKRNWGMPISAAARGAGDPSVTIWMWPFANQIGCLETLIWPVLKANYPMETACVDAATQCAGTSTWPISKLDKARVRCFLSLVYKQNPAVTLATVLCKAPTIIPMTDVAFDPLFNFLNTL